ncbi:MAG: hypothetical protein DRI57_14415 [Deltaproteobacteria bacterium]|nr:MAG: hypothetical protein DRI57_14415 [Deltaproteobacteria bacterium]
MQCSSVTLRLKQYKKADYNGFRGGHNLLKLLSHKTVALSDPGESGPMSGHIRPHGKHLFPGVSA